MEEAAASATKGARPPRSPVCFAFAAAAPGGASFLPGGRSQREATPVDALTGTEEPEVAVAVAAAAAAGAAAEEPEQP